MAIHRQFGKNIKDKQSTMMNGKWNKKINKTIVSLTYSLFSLAFASSQVEESLCNV